ncbi:MAG: hypothetical protein GVY11_02360 [Gammaproteobacteria bacterium]|jgi:hypothetical protein|nr:hypothetical protein [Gammaproteobacteria bacterium]
MNESTQLPGNGPVQSEAALWFFLGGNDLEMEAIREFLSQREVRTVSDRRLGWGARESDYGDEIIQRINEGYKPVLIELENDMALQPDTVIIIDHHGERAGAEAATSLEQVYQLFDVPFESAPEEHHAVAANDRGHVPELRRKGFSAERIRAIREKEWAVTGITCEEVAQAEAAIRHRLESRADVVTVQCPNDHASLIADLLLPEFRGRWESGEIPDEAIEPEILLVEGPSEWNVYGPGWTIKALKDRYPGDRSWAGGALPNRGFWGARKSELSASQSELLEIIAGSRLQASGPDAEQIWLAVPGASASIATEPGSLTQFILPVAYEPQRIDCENPELFYERLHFDESCSGKPDDELDLIYQRRRYFTEETGNMLYQQAGWFQLRGCNPKAGTLRFQSQATRRSVRLKWGRPRLVLFNWTVARALADRLESAPTAHEDESSTRPSNPLLNGFLILEIYPAEPVTLAELREFNETFRHLQLPWEEYGEEQLEPRYRGFRAHGLPWTSRVDVNLTDRVTWGKWLDLLEFPVRDRRSDRKTFYRIVPQSWISKAASVTAHESWAGQDHALKPAEPKALVWSCAVLDKKAQDARSKLLAPCNHAFELRSRLTYRSDRRRMERTARTSPELGDPKSSRRARNVRAGDWIGFLNVDRPTAEPPVRHEDLLDASGYEKDWAEHKSVTYQRWAHWGSLYGFTGHSGCAFLPAATEPPFWKQWRTIYRDQALFLLYERATLFRFSRSISSLTQQRFEDEAGTGPEKRRADRRFETNFRELRRNFVSFANLYQFPLLSTEQQSLEMYNAQRAALEVDPLYKEVQSQIDNAHAYASLSAQRHATELTTVITVLGIPLLVAGLVASLLGMDMAVPYAALLDVASQAGGSSLVDTIRASSGLVRVALWLLAVLIVLVPIRLFENRLIDFEPGRSFLRRYDIGLAVSTATRLFLLFLSGCSIFLALRVDGNIETAVAALVAAGFLGLALCPLYVMASAREAIRMLAEKKSLRAAKSAFISRVRTTIPLSAELTKIIKRQLEKRKYRESQNGNHESE